ncbi:hypothetical protein D6850_16450 [Roseovarius spongiae]|uniref:TnsA endonuclease N-terminal domain-containing protein n=1 Tax=Roseovarius spongiae TaxID=2320272 RepID=A0A3A8AR42_9RHOB|nr:hypothetical protein [Roseovarius spongiae]RKF13083.1 hypothetical protein D6850_16450 [Roseovarius spongiae]
MLFEHNIIDGKPARTIYKRGLQKKVNRQACRKAIGIIDTESVGESIILVAGEVDPRVRRIVAQPASFDLNTGQAYASKAALVEACRGTRYRPWIYTPDFLFELTSGKNVFVEGKHSRWLRDNPEFEAVRRAMSELGNRLSVVTEMMFPPALHRNLRVLRTLPDRQLDPSVRKLIETQLPDNLRFGTAQRSFGLTRQNVYAALFQGLLATDLAIAPFADRTNLFRTDGDVTHLQVLPL